MSAEEHWIVGEWQICHLFTIYIHKSTSTSTWRTKENQIVQIFYRTWDIQYTMWVPFQYPVRRLIVRSRKDSKARDRVLKYSYRFAIWQAYWQQCHRAACQISERSDNSKSKYRGFATLRYLMIRRLFEYWNRAEVVNSIQIIPICLSFCPRDLFY